MASIGSMSERKIILLGKTGDGKSRAGNTILAENVFTTKASANSVTDKCVSAERIVDGRKITVIDTPGFIDTNHDDMKIKSEIVKALTDCAPAVDAFVIVLKPGRYTKHEKKVVQKLLDTFKEGHILKHTVILFTFGEQLEGQTIEKFVQTSSQLQDLVNKCGGRCHVIDNTYWNNCHSGDKSNRVQVKNLMETIDKMVEENGRYSNELLQTVEEEIQKVMKINEGNLHSEDNRKKAKKMVEDILLRRAAGTATGALIGALLGVGVALAAVVVVLQMCPLKELVKAKVAVQEGLAVEAVVTGGAAAAAAEAGAAGGAAVAGGAAAAEAGAAGGAAVAGGAAAAAEAGAAGGAAIAGGAAAAAEAGAAGGAAVAGGAAAAETGAAAGAGTIAAGVFGVAALAGAVVGGVTGWNVAEEADSWHDAMKKAGTTNYQNAKTIVEKMQEFVTLICNKK